MLKEELEFVRNRMKRYYDKHRREGPCLEREDKVYLVSRNLRTKRPSKKLDFKKVELFKLQLDVFYISLLEPAPKNVRLATDVEADDEEEEWDVEEILDSRIANGKLEYLIK
ncbi:hypothetical protein VTK56DRAFT_4337 [Thermocarpiscus australiensis]